MTTIAYPEELNQRYEVQGVLGQGAMGVVFLATDRRLHREVAIKLVALEHDPDELVRARREAEVLARISHPGVVKIFDHGEIGRAPYIVMERLHGTTLEALCGSPRWNPSTIQDVLEKYLDALATVHACGVLHRDIKPSNLFLTADGEPIFLDFGLAKSLEATALLTAPGVVVGTLRYVPAEVLRGRPHSASSDQFSLALSMLTVWTAGDLHGERDCPAGQLSSTILSSLASGTYLTEARRLLRDQGPVGDLLLRAIASDPGRRFPDARTMLAQVRAVAKPSLARSIVRAPGPPPVAPPVTTSPPVAPSPPRARGTRSRATPALGVAVALCLLAIVWSRRPSATPVASVLPPPPSTASGASRGTLVGLLDLKVRPLDTSIDVRAFTTASCVLELEVVNISNGQHARSLVREPGPGFAHRLTVSRLEPDATYALHLGSAQPEVRQPEVRVEPPRPVVRTRPADSREDWLTVSNGTREFFADARESNVYLALRLTGRASEQQPLIEMTRRNPTESNVWSALLCLQELGTEESVPWIESLLERPCAYRVAVQAIGALESIGGSRAVALLERLTGRGRPLPETTEEARRPQVRSRAARALARIAPPLAHVWIDARHAGDAELAIALAAAQWLGWPAEQGLANRLSRSASPDALVGRRQAAVTAARLGPREAGALLRTAVGAWRLTRDELLIAVDGLATWDDGTAATDATFAPARLATMEPVDGVDDGWRRSRLLARAVQALGLIARRATDPAVRARAVDRILEHLAASTVKSVIRAAHLALAHAADPRACRALEATLATHVTPAPHEGPALPDAPAPVRPALALALARCGSPRADAAIGSVLVSSRPTDLWLAAVGASALPADRRSRLWPEIVAAAHRLPANLAQAELARSLKWLERRGSTPGIVWVDGQSPWTPTGLTVSAGDRFRIEACGVMAVRPARTGIGDLVGFEGLDESTESARDVFGPNGLGPTLTSPERSRTLTARIGRHEMAGPIGADDVLVAQDAGPVLLRLAAGELRSIHDHGKAGLAMPSDVPSEEPTAGLILAVVSRTP